MLAPQCVPPECTALSVYPELVWAEIKAAPPDVIVKGGDYMEDGVDSRSSIKGKCIDCVRLAFQEVTVSVGLTGWGSCVWCPGEADTTRVI